MKSHRRSVAESGIYMVVGMTAAYIGQLWVLPLYGYTLTHQDNLELVIFFSVISITKNYVLNRLFDRHQNTD